MVWEKVSSSLFRISYPHPYLNGLVKQEQQDKGSEGLQEDIGSLTTCQRSRLGSSPTALKSTSPAVERRCSRTLQKRSTPKLSTPGKLFRKFSSSMSRFADPDHRNHSGGLDSWARVSSGRGPETEVDETGSEGTWLLKPVARPSRSRSQRRSPT